MALNDIYELTLFQSFKNQVMINRWHYQVTSGGGNTATAFRDAWDNLVLPEISDIQSTQVTYTRLLARNLTNPSDNAENLTLTPSGGQGFATACPIRLAVAFRSNRPDLSQRYSWKRFGGVSDEFLVGDVFQDNAVSDLEDVANGMGSILTASGVTYTPVQVHAEPSPTPGGTPTYSVNYVITNWDWLAEPSTQDSRKVGRGI